MVYLVSQLLSKCRVANRNSAFKDTCYTSIHSPPLSLSFSIFLYTHPTPLSVCVLFSVFLYTHHLGAAVMAGGQGASQLFQVLYLGSTWVDRHCSHSILPWIAEELKLRTEQKIFTWLTPGLCCRESLQYSGAYKT